MPDPTTEYIDTIDYKKLETRIKILVSLMSELNSKSIASRRIRYVELDIEAERKAGKLAPDELYIPQHVIETNIRREQPAYVQYVTQSPRAVVLKDKKVPATDASLLELDATNRIRFDSWQLSLYACIDGFQQNGYGVMEVVYDESKLGHVAHEFVQLGDFGYVADSKDIQECELVARSYYFSRTKLLHLAQDSKSGWSKTQVDKIIEGEPQTGLSDSVIDSKDKSLFRVDKMMFRKKGIVQVAWTCERTADDWVCPPRPLFIGRRTPYTQQDIMTAQSINQPIDPVKQQMGKEAYEKDYPYILFPYLVSENDTISQLKGRVYLDQDTQEAASSLMSSFCTAHRRASGLYFSKDTDDPNASLALEKNVYFEQGALINAKIKQFQLTAPDAEVMQAIMAVISANQNETSQVNFATNNRKDSRKTATEISAASQSQQSLSTVQVVLFSQALRQVYELMFAIIQSRVIAGLIQDVDPTVKQMYGMQWSVKPSGDIDVIERQQLVTTMMSAWPVVQQTPIMGAFLADLLQKMFPEQAMKYLQILNQAEQQKNSQQAQQMQQVMGVAKQAGQELVWMAKHPEFFSETGRVNEFPKIQKAAQMVEQLMKQQGQQGGQAQ